MGARRRRRRRKNRTGPPVPQAKEPEKRAGQMISLLPACDENVIFV
jgi:hypothetical protein